MNKKIKLKKVISEQIKKINRPDLSTKEKSFTQWLEKHFQEINSKKIYYNPEQLIDYISKAKSEDHIYISNDYLEKVFKTIRNLRLPKKILSYLYNIYLSGSNLGLAESNGMTSRKPIKEHKKLLRVTEQN